MIINVKADKFCAKKGFPYLDNKEQYLSLQPD